MLTVAVISQKGGSGKSTIAVGLAVAHELAGGVSVVVRHAQEGQARNQTGQQSVEECLHRLLLAEKDESVPADT